MTSRTASEHQEDKNQKEYKTLIQTLKTLKGLKTLFHLFQSSNQMMIIAKNQGKAETWKGSNRRIGKDH